MSEENKKEETNSVFLNEKVSSPKEVEQVKQQVRPGEKMVEYEPNHFKVLKRLNG